MTLDPVQSPASRTLAAICAGIANYAILILCEITVQLFSEKYDFVILHIVSIICSIVGVVAVEAVLSRLRLAAAVKWGDTRWASAHSSHNLGVTMLWWAFLSLVCPGILFRLTNTIISWELSGIPYGYFAAIYLTFRTFQTWQEISSISRSNSSNSGDIK
jgi:hypothetical protein